MGRRKQIMTGNHSVDAFVDGVYKLGKEQERWLVLPDLQVPYHDEKSLKAVLEYASTQRWDGCIQLGDFMDWDFISRWSVDNLRKLEGQRFVEEYMKGNAVLDQIQEAVRAQNPEAHIVIIEGNHDNRIDQVASKMTTLIGLIEMEKNLRLDERNVMYWRYWTHKKMLSIGDAHFVHGDYTGTHHAKKMAEVYNRNIFYGHMHDVQAATRLSLESNPIQAWSLGTLSRYDLEYMGGRPSNWAQCFAEFYFRPDGEFNHYLTNITKSGFTTIGGKFFSR